MIFVLDTGNTNTVLGVFDNGELKYEWRIKTDRYKTEDEFGILIKSLFEHRGIALTDIKGVIISSVVPPIMLALEKMCSIYFGLQPLILGKSDVKSFLDMNYPYPEEIGADRIVNAVGAIHHYGAPLIIIDFGTATTYCSINEKQQYCGGVITPGVKISMEALNEKASKLPKIEIESPKQVVGKSTIEAMKSGIFYGYVAQVDGIVTRIKKEMRNEPKVIATGGLAPLLANAAETVDIVDPHLTLKGLFLIYEKNIATK